MDRTDFYLSSRLLFPVCGEWYVLCPRSIPAKLQSFGIFSVLKATDLERSLSPYSYYLQILLITPSPHLFRSGVIMAPCCCGHPPPLHVYLNLLNPTSALGSISFIKLSSIALFEHVLLFLLGHKS